MYYLDGVFSTIISLVEISAHILLVLVSYDFAVVVAHLKTGHFGSLVIEIVIAYAAPFAHIYLQPSLASAAGCGLIIDQPDSLVDRRLFEIEVNLAAFDNHIVLMSTALHGQLSIALHNVAFLALATHRLKMDLLLFTSTKVFALYVFADSIGILIIIEHPSIFIFQVSTNPPGRRLICVFEAERAPMSIQSELHPSYKIGLGFMVDDSEVQIRHIDIIHLDYRVRLAGLTIGLDL